MKKHLGLFIAAGILLFPAVAPAQLVLGQYEDEAPLGTWNILGVPTAPSLGCGTAGFAVAWDGASSLSNPSLLALLPSFTASLSGFHGNVSLFRFSILNTGVLATTGNMTASTTAFDFAGVSFRAGGWSLGISASLQEIYDRPAIVFEYSPEGRPVYSIQANQDGCLRNFQFAAARKISSRLSAGLGINVIAGKIRRDFTESFIDDGAVIEDTREQRLRGFRLNGGIHYEFSPNFSTAAVVKIPIIRNSVNRSELSYEVADAGTDIDLATSSKDTIREPLVFGAGAAWHPGKNLTVAADVSLFNWSAYKLNYFDEEAERNFRNTLRAALGFEHADSYRFFGRNVRIPMRIGILYDPQPMARPRSAYVSLTFGTGIALGNLRIDFAGAVGREHGSGNGLSARRAVLTLTYLPGGEGER